MFVLYLCTTSRGTVAYVPLLQYEGYPVESVYSFAPLLPLLLFRFALYRPYGDPYKYRAGHPPFIIQLASSLTPFDLTVDSCRLARSYEYCSYR